MFRKVSLAFARAASNNIIHARLTDIDSAGTSNVGENLLGGCLIPNRAGAAAKL